MTSLFTINKKTSLTEIQYSLHIAIVFIHSCCLAAISTDLIHEIYQIVIFCFSILTLYSWT